MNYNGDNLLNNIKNISVIKSNKYTYKGNPIPRVTEILSSMLHEDYLLGWSNYLGFKRKKYRTVLEHYANIGTYTHEGIELYLKDGSIIDIPNKYKFEAINSLKSFILWYDIVTSNNSVEILGMEQELICEYFGGTYDLLININGKTYLIDFKTSNYISYKHFIQASAYKYMLNLNNIIIDGVIILQLSKSDISFNEYILHVDNTEHNIFLDECLNTFLGLVYSYYNRLNIEQKFKDLF